jgi:flagella basal body P-ring formation protein FlgA
MKRLLPHNLLLFLLLAFFCPAATYATIDRELQVRELVTSFIATRTAGMGWDVHVRRISVSDAHKLPEGAIEFEIIAPQQWPGWGSVSLSVVARQKERVVRNIPVRVEVEALTDMVVALHQIERDTLISPSDVALQKREITQSSHLSARTIDDVVGKKTRTTLRANQPIRSDQLERQPLIKSGQMVTIIAENSIMRVTVAGKARSSGAEGDSIRVQNLTSLKEIPARVINATTVQVAF